MREILYRGFHPDENGTQTITLDGKKIKGKWVYGYYVEATCHWHKYGIHNSWIITSALQNGGCFNVMRRYSVITKTVGQFTGFTDKNDNKIFESDIISFSVFDYNGNDTQYTGVVKWSDMESKATRFMIWHDNENEYYGADGAFDLDWVHYQDSELKVIGNLYDNLELLNKD